MHELIECLNKSYRSKSVLGQLISDFGDLLLIQSLSDSVGLWYSLLVPFLGSLSSLAFQLFNEVLLAPSDLAWQISQLTELSEAAQLDSSQSIWDNLSFFSIIRSGDSFEDFQSAQSGSTDGLLVWEHTSDSSPEHSWGSSVMDVSSVGVG